MKVLQFYHTTGLNYMKESRKEIQDRGPMKKHLLKSSSTCRHSIVYYNCNATVVVLKSKVVQ